MTPPDPVARLHGLYAFALSRVAADLERIGAPPDAFQALEADIARVVHNFAVRIGARKGEPA